MTTNRYSDNESFEAGGVNAVVNALDVEGIQSGCAPSTGTGDWDVDVASGTVVVAGGSASVTAQPVALDAADASDDRVDLVTVDSAGTVGKVTGTPATTPASPDIPSDEVLVAVVLVRGESSSLAAGDIFDRRVLIPWSGHPIRSADILDGTIQQPDLGFAAVEASETTDGSDVTQYTRSAGGAGWGTLVNVSGSGVLLLALAFNEIDNTNDSLRVTVDGGTSWTSASIVPSGALLQIGMLPAVRFSSSLLVEHDGNGANGGDALAWVKQ